MIKNKRLRRKIRGYVIYLGIVLLIMIILLLLQINILSIFTIIILIIIGCFSKIYKRFTSLSIGFELVTPVTILFAYDVNILFAIVAAIFMVTAADFIGTDLKPNAILVQSGIYIIIAVVAGLFNSISIVTLGIGLIVFRNIVLFLIPVLFHGVDPIKMGIATIPNIFINSFIIAKLGEFLLSLL